MILKERLLQLKKKTPIMEPRAKMKIPPLYVQSVFKVSLMPARRYQEV